MKNIQRFVLATTMLVAFFSRTALAQKVENDYDHSVTFSQYHTYSWGHVYAADPLFEDRIREAVDRDLQASGWHQVPAEGDVTVTAVAVKKEHAQYNTFYNGLGPGWGWRGWGGGMAMTTVENIPVGTLVVDLYDTGSHKLIWRGMAHDQLSDKPEKNTQKLQKAVDKMFSKFPPRST
jgi:hypothetical protein